MSANVNKTAGEAVDGSRTGDDDSLVVVDRVPLEPTTAYAAVVRLNRPDVLNAMNWPLVRRLDRVLQSVNDEDDAAAVLITGNGRAFSAGGDLTSYLTLQEDPDAFPAFMDDLHRTFSAIPVMRVPVVALINGPTAAGGLELLLSCDFAIAARSARIGDAHLNYGQMGGGGALSLLPRMISPFRARELLFSARLLPAEEACKWGLVNHVVADDELLDEGLEFARGVAQKSPAAVAAAKYVMNSAYADGTGLRAALRLERERTALFCLTRPDSREGLEAFAEKRAPQFPGR